MGRAIIVLKDSCENDAQGIQDALSVILHRVVSWEIVQDVPKDVSVATADQLAASRRDNEKCVFLVVWFEEVMV